MRDGERGRTVVWETGLVTLWVPRDLVSLCFQGSPFLLHFLLSLPGVIFFLSLAEFKPTPLQPLFLSFPVWSSYILVGIVKGHSMFSEVGLSSNSVETS